MDENYFENSNCLQADDPISNSNRESFGPVSLRCPHCLHVGTFSAATSGLVFAKYLKGNSRTRGVELRAVARICPNIKCKGIVFSVSHENRIFKTFPPELIDFDADGLPDRLLTTLQEAISCHAAGAYRASAMMVRRLLEEICDESGATGKDLHTRLIALRSKVTLPEDLFEAMSELKALGNDAAHIAAKNYSQIGRDESEDSIALAKEILKARYQLKNLVDRLRARKTKNE